MSSADLLRRAADRIEQLAAETTRGPWRIEHDYSGRTPQALFVECADDHPDGHDGTRAIGGFDEPADNVWASALGPQVAAPLAVWLRAEADCQEAMATARQHLPDVLAAVEENLTHKPAPRSELRVQISTADQAVAFARAILGEEP